MKHDAVKCDAKILLTLNVPWGTLSVTTFSERCWGFSRALRDFEYKLVNHKVSKQPLK